MLDYAKQSVLIGMPNKRHPTRKYIGFWGTSGLKQKLQQVAASRGVTLSVLITQILWDFVAGVEAFVATLFLL